MTDNANENAVKPAGPVMSEVCRSRTAYLAFIDNARKVVAVTAAICGLGFVVCYNRDDYLTVTLRYDPGGWAVAKWVFGIGWLACLVATVVLVLEYLARPAAPAPIRLQSLLTRSALILIVTGGICYGTVLLYGPWNGFGMVLATVLMLAAARERRFARGVLASLGLFVLGVTLLPLTFKTHFVNEHEHFPTRSIVRLENGCNKRPMSHWYPWPHQTGPRPTRRRHLT